MFDLWQLSMCQAVAGLMLKVENRNVMEISHLHELNRYCTFPTPGYLKGMMYRLPYPSIVNHARHHTSTQRCTCPVSD